MQVIFTATLGRNGSQNLIDIFNRFGDDCLGEHEPPDLPLRQLGYRPFFRKRGWFGPASRTAMIGRNFQRRFIAPDELMGRGRALQWVEQGDTKKLEDLAKRRVRRLDRFASRGYQHYLEAGPYFLRTYGRQTHQLIPDLKLVKLTRDPLQNAKSFVNRSKDPFRISLRPDRPGNIFQLKGWESLSEFQLYVYLWIETELKFVDFVRRHPVEFVFYLETPELSNPDKITELFRFFEIEHRPVDALAPTNMAEDHKKPHTLVTPKDVDEFNRVIDLVPDHLLQQIDFLKGYQPVAG